MKLSKLVKVNNTRGIHLRPSAIIASTASQFKCKLSVFNGEKVVDAKSILDVASLAAPRDSMIEITAEGEDAKEALAELAKAVEKEFNFSIDE